jgi:N4-gp56 family major capsid protein
MAATSTSTVAGAGALQIAYDTTAVREFHKYSFLLGLSSLKRIKPQGSNSFTFPVVKAMSTITVANNTLVEGTNPIEESFEVEMKNVTLKIYGASCKLTTEVVADTSFDIVSEVLFEMSRRFAEVLDLVVQAKLNANITKQIFGADRATKVLIQSGDTMKATYLANARSILAANGASRLDGGKYVAVMHPLALNDLLKESGTGTFLDVRKYAQPDQILKGEFGELHGVRVLESAVIAKDAVGGVDATPVFPTYFLGKDAYSIVETGGIQTFVNSGADKADGLNMYTIVGLKSRFGVEVIKQGAAMIHWTAVSLTSAA